MATPQKLGLTDSFAEAVTDVPIKAAVAIARSTSRRGLNSMTDSILAKSHQVALALKVKGVVGLKAISDGSWNQAIAG